MGSLGTAGNAGTCAIEGDRLYLSDSAAGFQIVNISNPELPVSLTTVPSSGNVYQIAPYGRHVYVAEDNAGLASWLDSPAQAGGVPAAFVFRGVAPNPFSASAWITFELPEDRPVDLAIYDAAGRVIRRVEKGAVYSAGPCRILRDGRDRAGRQAAAGVYFFRLRAGEDEAIGRATLVK